MVSSLDTTGWDGYPLHWIGSKFISKDPQTSQDAICIWRDMESSACFGGQRGLLKDLHIMPLFPQSDCCRQAPDAGSDDEDFQGAKAVSIRRL